MLSSSADAAPPPSPSPSPSPVPVAGVERVEVRLAQYDVVVRDKAGRIVEGLKPENFSVIEDGVPLEVVAVDEWGLEQAPTELAPAASPEPVAPTPGTAVEAPRE